MYNVTLKKKKKKKKELHSSGTIPSFSTYRF